MKKLALAFSLFLSIPFLSMESAYAQQETQANNRIISAGSSITELLIALGAKNQLIAVDVTSRKYNTDEALPQVGYHRQLSAEGLMALSPTHLIGSHEMGPENTLTLLKSGGIKVETVPSGDTEEDLFGRIDKIAQITGTQEKAKALKASIDKQLNELKSRKLEHQPKVLFAMLTKGRPATIAGDQTTIDVIINLAGGQNPAKSEMSSYKPLTAEAIVQMQPDFLLVSTRAWEALGGHEGILKEFPLLAATPVAGKDRIIPVSSSAIIGGFGLESLELTDELYKVFQKLD
ncbi:heme/hemin ABC transporter substrate-binding protein [Vibrio diazotrophicus]|uniref:heme/hemin ABC transporter substrate-binding protein n=1 Tax=Vibrio diazotrophicus TaxID=685 RepID=UPI000C9E08FE|nr:ABC transporter substrate-binding protein [Vibrio diazotrophicus]PNH89009.1 hemin ABC transporter substrate-binding protein [Vibrio diazotrophicus]